MFTRSQSGDEGDTPSELTGDEASRALDQVLSDIQPARVPVADLDADAVAAGVEKHADTLRATREAHREAQAMLTRAAQAREDASEEAERVVLEARHAAERARSELAGWAAAQRAKVEALVADMATSARHEADAIRAEALRTSMAEAEESARGYVAQAAAAAERDAEAIREEARHVLRRATELGHDVDAAIDDFATATSAVAARLDEARSAMEQLLAANPPAVVSDAYDMPSAPSGPQDEPDEEPIGGDLDEDAAEAAALDSVEQEAVADQPDDELDPATPADEDPVRDATEESDELQDRQLGSMFRRQGQRGQRGGR